MRLRAVSYTQSVLPWQEPCDVFSAYAHHNYAVLLTGKGPAESARFSLIGIDPHSIIRHNGEEMTITTSVSEMTEHCTLWDCITDISMIFTALNMPIADAHFGAVGFLSYDALTTIESTELRSRESYSLPLCMAVIYNRYHVFDHKEKQHYSVDVSYSIDSHIKSVTVFSSENPAIGAFFAECNRHDYCANVERVKEYILDGDVYEVSLSQRFSASFHGDPYGLFRSLFDKNPAPYSAFMTWDDTALVCNSPELFVRIEGNAIETRPIKGTIGRGNTAEEDMIMKERLLASEKDQAELYMIVDLLRNDLGKVCDVGSVVVNYPKRCETYETVHHLVASVSGTLHVPYGEALKAVFPGGSITGCPKIRSTEIIDELETFKRHLYTGSIFVLNHHFCSANIAIRTGIIQHDTLFLNSGGAVTIDSDPHAEYDEIIQKIKNFFAAAGADDLA